MKFAASGNTAALASAIEGRSAFGLEAPEDLAVDAVANLAIDGADDLAVFDGVRWRGLGAAKSIAVTGQTLDEMSSI